MHTSTREIIYVTRSSTPETAWATLAAGFWRWRLPSRVLIEHLWSDQVPALDVQGKEMHHVPHRACLPADGLGAADRIPCTQHKQMHARL